MLRDEYCVCDIQFLTKYIDNMVNRLISAGFLLSLCVFLLHASPSTLVAKYSEAPFNKRRELKASLFKDLEMQRSDGALVMKHSTQYLFRPINAQLCWNYCRFFSQCYIYIYIVG